MTQLNFPALILASLLAAPGPATARETSPAVAPHQQAEAYAAEVPKTIVELQQFRRTQTQRAVGPGGRQGTATLIDLNPVIGVWYLLSLDWGDGSPHDYHLENATPDTQTVTLDAAPGSGLMLSDAAGRHPCPLWSDRLLETAATGAGPYVPVCDGRLYLHTAAKGRRSNLEAVVEFLRDNVWGGEEVVTLAKETVLKDAGREQAELGIGSSPASPPPGAAQMPVPARLDPGYAERQIGRGSLGIRVADADDRTLPVGRWTPARDVKGTFLSLIAPEAIAPEILRSHRDRANALDAKESSALVYLIAFDLDRFNLGFGLGTDHPRVDWSVRPPKAVHPQGLPGPDGIDSIKPLITTGMVPPYDTARTVAAFAGGYKRYHGAFKYGDLALRNYGTHYGFIQEGVVLSKLQPELSTLYVLQNGSVHMHAWTEADNRKLAQVRYARQSGVPLVEWDRASGEPIPGALVNRWGPGNWSGSAEESLRTVRAGACLQRTPDTQYLIYAYFSNATPSAMARVFQAYGCHHAMQLDINAPILTYLAVYPGGGIEPAVQYLVQPMVEADRLVNGRPVPRFLGLPDNRDFFYLTRREGGPT